MSNIVIDIGKCSGFANVSLGEHSVKFKAKAEGILPSNLSSAITYTKKELPTNYLDFSSSYVFSMRFPTFVGTPAWNGTLYYSIDLLTWRVWNGSQISSSTVGEKKHIYICGKNNTFVRGVAIGGFIITTSSQTRTVACSGNIDSLLDYTLTNINRATSCFKKLFMGCTKLSTAPTLSNTLTANCYESMFEGCTNLTKISSFEATSLPYECCKNMYKGCTRVNVSETETSSYQYEFRIPKTGIALVGTDSLLDMFAGTSGSFTGTPVANTTYYLTNEPNL